MHMNFQIGDKVKVVGQNGCGDCHPNHSFDVSYNDQIGEVYFLESEKIGDDKKTVYFSDKSVVGWRKKPYKGTFQNLCVNHLRPAISPMKVLFQSEPFKTMRENYVKSTKRNKRTAKKDRTTIKRAPKPKNAPSARSKGKKR